MADYWMKLYIEILDDPKMATLPDRIWRRIIELFLVAKRINKGGALPDTRQIAWMLRMNPDDLEHDMMQIQSTGIVVREVNGWFIPKFAQRQAAVPDAERKAQERSRKQSQQYYGDVTDLSRNVTQRTEDRLTENREQRTETEVEQKSSPPDMFDELKNTAASKGIMAVTKADADTLLSMVKDGITPADLLDAIAWKTDHNDGKPIRYFSSLVGPAKTAQAKRLQSGNGKPKQVRILTGPNGEQIEVEA